MKQHISRSWLAALLIAMATGMPAYSYAQVASTLVAGTKIRMRTASPNEWRTGYIQSIDSSSISVNATRDGKNTRSGEAAYSWTVPLSSVNRLEVSRGRGGRAGRTIAGALLGGIGGGVLLGAIGYMATQCSDCEESGIGLLAGPFFGVPIGTVLGGMIGFATKPERWEPISIGGNGVARR